MPEWQQIYPTPDLTDEEISVIRNSSTEAPFTGKYDNFSTKGLFLCRQCGLPLYRSGDKFDCGCGWPAFDDSLPEAVKRRLDPDGARTEIICANCAAHLGHVFIGERLTPKNTRHCVNSLSLYYLRTEEACFAAGCFWGVEDSFTEMKGVVAVTVGYTGGTTANPTYREVCRDTTGHVEAVLIEFDPTVTTFPQLVDVFFEIHDPTTVDRQGPDIGRQYRSAIFYVDDSQKEIAEQIIARLKASGINAVTEVEKLGVFYPAEDYHQKYFAKQR